MAEITAADVRTGEFVARLSGEIDRVFARMSVSRGMGVLSGEAKPRLMAMTGPDPARFDEILGHYAVLAMSTGAEKNTTASSDPHGEPASRQRVSDLAGKAYQKVEPWTGSAADNFDVFIQSFQPTGSTVVTQRIFIDRLQFAAEAEQLVYVNSRMDLWNLIQALDVAIDSSEDISSSNVAVVLTVIAAIASAGTTLLAGSIGAGVMVSSLVAAAGSSGAAVIGGHANDNRLDQALDPHDKYTLRDSLLDVIGTMEADLTAAEDTVRLAVEALTAQMDPMSNGGRDLIGPSVTGWTGRSAPIEWDLEGTGTLSPSYLGQFVPPSETE